MKISKINLIFISLFFFLILLANISAEIIFFNEPQKTFVIGSAEITISSSTEGTTSSESGGKIISGTICANNSDCGYNEYCLNSTCYQYECSSNKECETDQFCWEHKCTKITGMTIFQMNSLALFFKNYYGEILIFITAGLLILFLIKYKTKKKSYI